MLQNITFPIRSQRNHVDIIPAMAAPIIKQSVVTVELIAPTTKYNSRYRGIMWLLYQTRLTIQLNTMLSHMHELYGHFIPAMASPTTEQCVLTEEPCAHCTMYQPWLVLQLNTMLSHMNHVVILPAMAATTTEWSVHYTSHGYSRR